MPRRRTERESPGPAGAAGARHLRDAGRYAIQRGVPVRLEPRRRDAEGSAAEPSVRPCTSVDLVPVEFGAATIVIEHTAWGATMHVVGDGVCLRVTGGPGEVARLGHALAVAGRS